MILTEWNTEDAIAFARKEGLEDGRKETAKNLKENGVSIEIIARSTGMTPEEIANL